MIDGLQREVDGLRASLDRVKGDLRTSQRVVSQVRIDIEGYGVQYFSTSDGIAIFAHP